MMAKVPSQAVAGEISFTSAFVLLPEDSRVDEWIQGMESLQSGVAGLAISIKQKLLTERRAVWL